MGRGLHVEAEWDTASSDPFEKARKSIDEKLAVTPPPANKAELEADLAKLDGISNAILKDVATSVELMNQKMLGRRPAGRQPAPLEGRARRRVHEAAGPPASSGSELSRS